MEISYDISKISKILINNIKPRPSTNIRMDGKTLEEVDQFKNLESTETKDGTSKKEVKIKLAQALSSKTRLAILWRNNAISFPTNITRYESLVLSVLMGESRPLKTNATEELLAYHTESMKQANMCGNRSTHRRTLRTFTVNVKRRKLSWFGYVCRHDTLPKIILQGTVDSSRRRGRPRKSWKDNIRERTGQSRMTEVDGQSSQQIHLSEYPQRTTPGRHGY